MHQYATLEDTVYLGFASNLTSGAAGDGASPTFQVREAGAASSAAPTLTGTPTLLSHASHVDGSYEVAVAATAANGFAAGKTYLVFAGLTISSVIPNACIGSFKLSPVPADAVKLGGTTQTGRDVGASVLLSSGTGAGQISLSSGVASSDVKKVNGTTIVGDGSGTPFGV